MTWDMNPGSMYNKPAHYLSEIRRLLVHIGLEKFDMIEEAIRKAAK